jgi:DNA-binding transcriptional LysR family regulator
MMETAPTIDAGLLRTFSVVAETRHFTRAAERLNCVQSAVSMQIRRLEDRLQVRLLDRSKRGVKLTPEGEILLRHAHRITRLTDETLTEMGRRGASGRVRVGATDISMCYMPRVLERFHARHPMVDVELRCNRSWEALDALEAGEIDMAFVSQVCGRSGGAEVSRSPLVWACATHSEVDERDPVPLALFGPGCIYRKAAIDALEAVGKKFRLAYESPSRAGLDCAVGAGLAVTIVPMDYLDDRLRVVPAAPGGFPDLPVLKTYLFGAGSNQSAPAKAFAALLAETMATGR